MKVLELIGLPGVGKSSIADELLRIHPDLFAGVHTVYRDSNPKWLTQLCKVFLKPKLSLKVERLVFYSLVLGKIEKYTWIKPLVEGQLVSRDKKVARQIKSQILLAACVAEYIFNKKHHIDKMIILDEGLLHRATSLFAETSHHQEKSIRQYVGRVSDASTLIFIDAPTDFAFHHSAQRGHPERVKAMNENQQVKYFSDTRDLLEIIFDSAHCKTKRRIINNGELTLQSIAAAIVEQVTQDS